MKITKIFAFFCFAFCVSIPYVSASPKSLQECKNSLKFEDIDFNKAVVRRYKPTLKQYFLCSASIRNKRSLCSYCSDPNDCLKMYDVFTGCFAQLARKGATPDVLIACRKASKAERTRGIDIFFKAIALKDPKMCDEISYLPDNATECRAIASRDVVMCEKLSENSSCKDIINFLLALEQNNSSYCSRQNSQFKKAICIGLVEGNCESLNDFREFRNGYCDETCTR